MKLKNQAGKGINKKWTGKRLNKKSSRLKSKEKIKKNIKKAKSTKLENLIAQQKIKM